MSNQSMNTKMINVYELQNITKSDLDRLMKRSQSDLDQIKTRVEEIITLVRTDGDNALIRFAQKWDDADFSLSKLKVTEADIEEAYRNTKNEVIEKIKEQILLARGFHKLQKQHILDWEQEMESGIVVGEKWTPIANVGLYVPGGKNPFPTVQQILAVAATTANCPRIISCISAKGKNYEVLIAANECGIKEIYRVGGVQAIAAMAYGTETIAPVDLIAGPGSAYVTAAKMLCQTKVAIDMPAGPSEVIILADSSTTTNCDLNTKAKYCAADLLAQAEHGPDSAVLLLTNSRELADLVSGELQLQFEKLSRKDDIAKSLSAYGAILITPSMTEAINFINEYAPEHLEIFTENPEATLKQIQHAGTVFLGCDTPVASGDYAIGINFCLPTGGWARQSSAVGVWTFMKRVQFSSVNKPGLKRLQPIVKTISEIEGLDAHRRSVEIRFE